MKPIVTRPGSFGSRKASVPRPSFGQARADQMQQRMDKAFKERRTLAAAQIGAQQTNNEPLQQALAVKERMTEHKIDRLVAEMPISGKSED